MADNGDKLKTDTAGHLNDRGPIKVAFYIRTDLADALGRIARKQEVTPDILLNEIVASWLGKK